MAAIQQVLAIDARRHWGPKGVYVMNTTDRNTNQYTNDYLAGYTARIRWSSIETAAATYSWDLLDEIMQRTHARQQKVTLEIFARNVPAHVMAALSQATWTDHRGFVTCVPWDANAVAAWESFVAVLAAHLTPLANGAGTVALADHPALESIDASLVGLQSVRDINGTLVIRGDYNRTTFINSCKAAVQVMRDNFPDKYTFVGVFPMEDATSSPRLDTAVVDALLDEFVPHGTLDPKLGFFQELLSDSGPELGSVGEPLSRAKLRTWVIFQALSQWTDPWTGQSKLASGDPTVGANFALQIYNSRYVELYAKDIQNPALQTNLSAWGSLLTDGEYPLPSSTVPSVTISNPDEGDAVSGTYSITAAITPPDGTTITQAEFIINGVTLHTDTIAPYGYNWSTILTPDGNCTIEVRVTDSNGGVGSGYRNCIVQNVSSNPSAELLEPDTSKPLSGVVGFAVSAVDLHGVASVAFWFNGVLKVTRTSAPYVYNWNSATVSNGSIPFEAIVTDTLGNSTTLSETLYVAN